MNLYMQMGVYFAPDHSHTCLILYNTTLKVGLQQTIMYVIDSSVDYFLDYLFDLQYKTVRNACYNIPKPKVTSSKVLFCPTNISKPKNIQFTIMLN